MKPHCVHMVKYVLPAIRAMVAKELIERGYKIKEVAEMLGLTQAAVSQYLRSKRGKRGLELLEKNDEVKKIVAEIADVVSKKKDAKSEEYVCRICEAMRDL
ncbi:MAG: helix-turn-helix domain-containing protein [Archaeoglobaceae archaeon]